MGVQTGEDDGWGTSDREWLFAVDESGTKQTPVYGFGALILKSDRRGDLAKGFRALCEAHGMKDEVKWNKVSERNREFYEALVTWFFKTKWLAFHCIVVRKADIDKARSDGSYDLAWRKFLTMFVTDKCRRLANSGVVPSADVRVWVDPIQSSYAKADEALNVIANNMLAQKVSHRCKIVDVSTRDSREVPAIQLCDVLIGAVVTSFLGRAQGGAKVSLQEWIAHHLGWKHLAHGTKQQQVKFNVWHFWDRANGPREVLAEPVNLKYEHP